MELNLTNETYETFRDCHENIGQVFYKGGSSIIEFNKSIRALHKKWSILQSSVLTRKIKKSEKPAILQMISASLDFLSEIQYEFSSASYAKSALPALVLKFEEEVTKKLMGEKACKEVVVKLRGLIKNNRSFPTISWAKLGEWKVGSNNNFKPPKKSHHNQSHYNNSRSNNQNFNFKTGYKPKNNGQGSGSGGNSGTRFGP